MLDVLLTCVAFNVYFESRGEPFQGQIAVAEVTLRRAELSGRAVCSEVFEDKQFSWTEKQRPMVMNPKAWQIAVQAAQTALLGSTNVSNGATHFHARYVSPKWRLALCHAITIGKHVFYKPCSGKGEHM